MRHQGRITTWKDDRGFGFITPSDGGEQVFVHINSFLSRMRRPAENETVTYELGAGGDGRPQARMVAVVGDPAKTPTTRGRGNLPVLFAVCFLILVAAVVVAGWIPSVVLSLYIGASVVTFLAYAIDKSAAVRNQWRTQESTLHFFALVGGWPGALVAQRLLRHKSSKASFQRVFWVTVVFNCSFFGWWLTPQGSKVLNVLVATICQSQDAVWLCSWAGIA
ncbi:DUF1294 domain-containing protein [Castellaniella hirudinis]|uniref:DUF1294 domain-containing protein n=1 Tax=Castellaniella hirudinis TaxID=1144617 RepID=UPI0039C046AA